ncbi:---NA--- [Paramuricea clavata]|uniref:---NA n=1 Tax=Paramuricea clavata TaxID=317549 RepID=A0A6S7K7U1_PARCT|nr:---NA--- [Paramuricea clavata]
MTTNDYGVVTNMVTISEEGMQTMGEMFESGEALAAENEKAELDVLVDVINEHLDYFNEDKNFEKKVEDAVQEIEIPPKHPCPNCTKICKSKGGLTRHIRSKHTLLDTNDGKDDNSASTATKPTISKAIVEDLFKKANSKIKDNLYGEEIVIICKNLKPSSFCADVLDKLHRRFIKKSNQDTLLSTSELYKLLSKEPEKLVDNQPTDKRWSLEQIRIAVNLLFIHLPEFLVLAT